ncbi:Translation initiation factor SUI1 [Gracilaria domingensis]|nr:Translation initiation factor SUI1 [Gracilaria domingensis]
MDLRFSDRSLRAAVLDRAVFDPEDPNIKLDIVQTIIQYLHDEGYHDSSTAVQDETNVKIKNAASRRAQLRRMKSAILEGDWQEVEHLLSRTTFKSMKAFKFAVHKQQFLEFIDDQERQKAFSILQRRLKDLESYASTPDEFRDMCYLLTCKSVTDAPSFRYWDGAASSRAALVEQYSRLLEFESFQREGYLPQTRSVNGETLIEASKIPPARLVHLLQQALAFQIASSRHAPKLPPRIGTLLEDYESVVIPNKLQRAFVGHSGNVKCVTFVGEEGDTIASGSSDNTARIWDTSSGALKRILCGHTSRIWDISATANGKLLASASGDGTIRVWDTGTLLDVHDKPEWPVKRYNQSAGKLSFNGDMGADVALCRAVLQGHESDVYAVRMQARGNAVASGGYDRLVRFYDTETQTLLKSFAGHKSSISSVGFNARGNLIVTGSKDSSIKFWDVVSGLCVRTLSAHLGEVTSVEFNESGSLMVSSSKDNSNRLWDIRMTKVVKRFKGHQNTSKNFVRSTFGPRESVVIGGSEDGHVYIWDVESSEVLQKLGAAEGTVYDVKWNARQSVLASCAHDGVTGHDLQSCDKSEVSGGQEHCRRLGGHGGTEPGMGERCRKGEEAGAEADRGGWVPVQSKRAARMWWSQVTFAAERSAVSDTMRWMFPWTTIRMAAVGAAAGDEGSAALSAVKGASPVERAGGGDGELRRAAQLGEVAEVQVAPDVRVAGEGAHWRRRRQRAAELRNVGGREVRQNGQQRVAGKLLQPHGAAMAGATRATARPNGVEEGAAAARLAPRPTERRARRGIFHARGGARACAGGHRARAALAAAPAAPVGLSASACPACLPACLPAATAVLLRPPPRSLPFVPAPARPHAPPTAAQRRFMNTGDALLGGVTAPFDPFADADGDDQVVTKGIVHIRLQQRNGRKSLTTIQGLDDKLDLAKLTKAFKKVFCCNGCVVDNAELGKVIQLQGDQREKVKGFLSDEKIASKSMIKVHGI